MNEHNFELLAVDHRTSTGCDNATSLMHSLRGVSRLWTNPRIDEATTTINDDGYQVTIAEIAPPNSEDETADAPFGKAFLVRMTGTRDAVGPLRQPLTENLKDRQRFDPLYVVRDDVSHAIASELYPLLYRLENLLRGYLIKFMTVHLGPGWWNVTAPEDVALKAKQRKGNERVFGKHIDNATYLIDFGEVGQMIYEQTSGYLKREDIVKKINQLPETVDAIKELKAELQTNYQKFFKESFADQDFKTKWQAFEALRNKIAHNNLFTAEDLEQGQQLSAEIEEVINKADERTATLIITRQEREAIQDTVSEHTPGLRSISEEEFLNELKQQEDYFAQTNGFVGVTRFIRTHLVSKGYNHVAAYQLLQELDANGVVEVYHVPNPYSDFETAAIRTVNAEVTATP
ncbi:MAG: HEPN domain-containing protein [Planctomycetaceae bacterium]